MRQKYSIALTGRALSQIPSAHVDVNAPFNTTNAALVDITGMVLTLANTLACKFLVSLTGDFNTTGAGTATSIAYAVNVDGVDHDEQHLDFANVDTDQTGALVHTSLTLSPGTHTIKGRMRRVSGTQTAVFTSGMLTAVALQT